MTFLKVLPDTAAVAQPDPARIAAFRNEQLEIHMFYVGHGELNLVVFPDRRAWIIEVGSGNHWPDNDSLGALLAQYLVRENLTLDALVMAHAHMDHVGAVPTLLETGGYFYTSPLRLYRNDSTSWDRRNCGTGSARNMKWRRNRWRRRTTSFACRATRANSSG